MIRLTRVRTTVHVPKSLRGASRTDKVMVLLLNRQAGGRFDSTFWKKKGYWKAAKRQLKREANGKCSYCESPASAVTHCDVEHFRPKSKYWWLAYCYDNLLYVCQICNEAFKGDAFPVLGRALSMPKVQKTMGHDALRRLADRVCPDPVTNGAVAALADFTARCRAELPQLVNPYCDSPCEIIAYRADEVLKEVWAEANGKSKEAQARFRHVEELYGLNREELREWRWRLVYKHLVRYKQILAGRLSAAARHATCATVREMMRGEEAYAGMVRYFVRTKWRLRMR